MTKISREEVLKLAKLSRLHLHNSEADELTRELDSILNYVAQLQKVDLKEYKATDQVTGLKSVMREDVPINYGVSSKQLLKNVPELEDGYIKVRRVIE